MYTYQQIWYKTSVIKSWIKMAVEFVSIIQNNSLHKYICSIFYWILRVGVVFYFITIVSFGCCFLFILHVDIFVYTTLHFYIYIYFHVRWQFMFCFKCFSLFFHIVESINVSLSWYHKTFFLSQFQISWLCICTELKFFVV